MIIVEQTIVQIRTAAGILIHGLAVAAFKYRIANQCRGVLSAEYRTAGAAGPVITERTVLQRRISSGTAVKRSALNRRPVVDYQAVSD